MSYVKTVWANGDKVTSVKLNKIEDELEALDQRPSGGGAEPVLILIDTTDGSQPVGWELATFDSQCEEVLAAAAAGSPVYFVLGQYDSGTQTMTEVTEVIPAVPRVNGNSEYEIASVIYVTSIDDFAVGGYVLHVGSTGFSDDVLFEYLDGVLTPGGGGDGGVAGGD